MQFNITTFYLTRVGIIYYILYTLLQMCMSFLNNLTDMANNDTQ